MQIELEIEGEIICTRDGYVPTRICTRDGYVPARILTRDGYVHVTALQRTCDGYVPVTSLRTDEASWPAYWRTIVLLSAYDRPDIGVRLACYQHTIGFRRTVLIIVYNHKTISLTLKGVELY